MLEIASLILMLLSSESVSQISPDMETTCIKRLTLLKASTHTLKKIRIIVTGSHSAYPINNT